MTTKDFKLVSSILNYSKGIRITKEGFTNLFANKFEMLYPKFNKDKFLEGCGVEMKCQCGSSELPTIHNKEDCKNPY